MYIPTAVKFFLRYLIELGISSPAQLLISFSVKRFPYPWACSIEQVLHWEWILQKIPTFGLSENNTFFLVPL